MTKNILKYSQIYIYRDEHGYIGLFENRSQENAWRDKIHSQNKRMDQRKKKEKYPQTKGYQQQWNGDPPNALNYF